MVRPGDFTGSSRRILILSEKRFPRSIQAAKEIAEEYGFGQVVYLVAVLPVYPHVFNSDISAIVSLLQTQDNTPIVDFIAGE